MRRIRFTGRWRRRDRELEEELRFHLERSAAKAGSPRAAKALFGGVEAIKEECRAERHGALLAGFASDLRLGWRLLRRNPGFAAAAIVLLALAIGANTAMFSTVQALLRFPLPFRNPARIVSVVSADAHGQPQAYNPIWSGQFAELRSGAPAFAGFAGWNYSDANLSAAHQAVHVQVLHVTRGFFQVWGVAAAEGRTFQPGDGPRVMVLNGKFWRNALGGAPLVGQPVRLDGVAYTVIGIMPADFADNNGLFGPQVWIPLQLTPAQLTAHDRATVATLQAAGRLRPGATVAEARAEAAAIAHRDSARYHQDFGAVAIPVRQEIELGENASVLYFMQGITGLLLLIGCASVGGLLLERGLARAPEMRTRLALGAPRARLVRQLLTEGLLLAALAAIASLGVAAFLVRLLNLMLQNGVPLVTRPNLGVLASTAVAALVTVLIAGLAPALQISRMRPGLASPRRLRALLVTSEIALATACLIATAALIAAVQHELRAPLGFQPRGVVAADLTLAGPGYAAPAHRTAFIADLLAAAAHLPGVTQAAMVNPPALSWDQPTVQAQGHSLDAGQNEPPIKVRAITPGYFRLLKIFRLAGRSFEASDSAVSAPVAIVSRSAAARLFPGVADPIGHYLRIVRPGEPEGWRRVVGVVAGMVSYAGENADARANVYEPLAQAAPPSSFGILLRGPAGANFQRALRAQVAGLDSTIALFDYRPLTDDVAANIGGDRQVGEFFLGLDLVVLLASAIGLYGIVAFAAARRRREIAIRMALGESRAGAARRLLRGGLRLVAIGMAEGLGLAWLDSYVIASMVPGIPVRTPALFAAPAALLFAVALAASAVPAVRAARCEPFPVLKEL